MSAENAPPVECDEKQPLKDDDSVISDRCFQENHRGDSRKWLIRDASRQKMDSSICSTMKATYLYPFQEKREHERFGVRRYLLRKQLYEQMRDEILKEESEEPPVEEYCTEYDGNFNADGFQPPEEYQLEPELAEKYPLYSSYAASYWNCQFKETNNVQGVTKVADCKVPFRRSYNFSKSLSEVLDE